MERRREQLQQEGACIERPLGRPKLAPLSLSYPSTPSLQSSGKPLEAPPALSEPTPHSHIASATSHPDVQPTEHPTASPTPPEPATSIAPSSSAFHLPRITTRGWDVAALCRDFKSFEHVRRVSALSEPAELLKTLENYERDGLPLIIDNWDKHSKWPADVFNIDWLLQTAGDQHIHVRNVHDRQDRSMTLSEFVNISRAQSCHSSPGESQRLYWKDADCPPKWREWLLKSGAIPTPVLPGSPDDYLGYLFPSETVESLLCYMGVGDTYTAAHKDLCASSGHNLMCFSEQGGSSFWFMTAANDAPEVAKYFHQELGQELDWETHVTSIEELGRAPFKVYIAEQKVGDLVLVPPRSCHQVVNHGGLAMKTSWSRMTLDNLKTALHCELPIYHRVCRPEQYRVKTVLYRSMLHLTEMLQAALTPTPGPEPDPRGELAVTLEPDDIVGPLDAPEAFNALANYGDSPSSSSRPSPDPSLDLTERALKLKRLVQLFDEVLRAEFVSTHAKLEHIFRSDTSAGWGLTASSSTSSSAEKSTDEGSSSGGLKLFLQPPTAPSDRRENDKLKERAASCNLACDFCGADIFQSFFECKQCRTPEPGVMPQVGDGLLLCAACYVEGRICECEEMEPVQCRPFEVLLSDRNLAAKAVSALLPPDEDVQELQER
ncbi:hypothetical protein BV20DRAFT_397091 [Pilatotrama ljubarskyi]|nr:hypothetical protein BV20DRAFT_397091 [Pilatotrama ljubarskyi]